MEKLIEQIKNLDNITTHNFECSYFNDTKLVRMDDVIKLIEEAYEQGKADAITEIFKGIYEHFEEHHIEVFGKDEVLDEIILFLDEYYVYTKLKEKLKEQK